MTFGLITEGLTDQLVIRTIIRSIIGEERADTTPLRPMQDEPSGYPKVFDYIRSPEFKEFLIAEDTSVVIQLDTDTRGRWTEFFQQDEGALRLLQAIPVVSGSDKDKVKNIVANVIALLRYLIGAADYDAYQDRIICAISVNEMECWVLPYHAISNSDKSKMVSCLSSINKILEESGAGYFIGPNAKYQYYQKAIKDMTKRKTLLEKYHHNESLKIFVDRLMTI
jgi:hypothetical protein